MYENHDYQNNDLPAKETFEAMEKKIADLEANAISVALRNESQLTYYKDKYFTEAGKISDVKDYLDEMWDDSTDESVAEEYETIANKLGIDLTIEREFTVTASFTFTIKGKRGEVDFDNIDDSDFDVSISKARYGNDWSMDDADGSIDSVEQS